MIYDGYLLGLHHTLFQPCPRQGLPSICAFSNNWILMNLLPKQSCRENTTSLTMLSFATKDSVRERVQFANSCFMQTQSISWWSGLGCQQHESSYQLEKEQQILFIKQGAAWGSGCGSVGRAVASDTRGPWFESSHRQKFIYRTFVYCQLCIEKTKNKKNRPGMVHFLKKL